MKLQQFSSEVGATVGCTLRLLINTIPLQMGCVKYEIRGDAWFGSVQRANEVALQGHKVAHKIKQ
jgi:hypothetical protein